MKKGIIVALAIAAIGFAAYRFWPGGGKAPRRLEVRGRLCEACGHRFKGPTDDILLVCPKCNERAGVRVHVYQCHQCSHRFEAFHSKPEDESLTEIDPMKPPPTMLYRVPGGEWQRSWRKVKKQLKCPECGSTDVGPPLPQ
ncbi:MAG: hypothetical protein ACODAJ_13995 [Planctomycetota bacterium]